MRATTPLAVRFWRKVSAPSLKECWEWQGYVASNGYGTFGWPARFVHRIAYELVKGPIPEGLHIDHLCRNRKCVNPAHLEAVTQRVNTLRGEGPAALNARKTYCVHGHPLVAGNLYVYEGVRICRTCRIKATRERKERLRELRG